MAGSYNHVITNSGQLRNRLNVLDMLDARGCPDVYEAIKELYGMIWYLANLVDGDGRYEGLMTKAQIVEEARQNYKDGLELSPGTNRMEI